MFRCCRGSGSRTSGHADRPITETICFPGRDEPDRRVSGRGARGRERYRICDRGSRAPQELRRNVARRLRGIDAGRKNENSALCIRCLAALRGSGIRRTRDSPARFAPNRAHHANRQPQGLLQTVHALRRRGARGRQRAGGVRLSFSSRERLFPCARPPAWNVHRVRPVMQEASDHDIEVQMPGRRTSTCPGVAGASACGW